MRGRDPNNPRVPGIIKSIKLPDDCWEYLKKSNLSYGEAIKKLVIQEKARKTKKIMFYINELQQQGLVQVEITRIFRFDHKAYTLDSQGSLTPVLLKAGDNYEFITDKSDSELSNKLESLGLPEGQWLG